MYIYSVGLGIMGLVWLFFFIARKDMRKPMIWSGAFYAITLSATFFIGSFGHAFLSQDLARTIIPGYWDPPTLFNLGKITGGCAIEDILFMFLAGGISSVLYEFFFHKKIAFRKVGHFKRRYAFLFGILAAIIFHQIFYLNDIYLLIVFNLVGALTVLFQRKDLIPHSILGGLLFLCTYIVMFLFFKQIYPNFLDDIYNLQLTSGIIFLGIPLEEYLYSLTFGMIWAPIYEYEHRYKDK